MKTYINIQQSHIPSYNLEIASNAFNKLNEGHIQAIQAQSELQTAVSQLDLNETEEDFRQQLVNEIDNTVKQGTRYNNAYFALPDIIQKAGNINSNPELIGRLKAQQAYKANIEAIDSRTDINDAAKEMAKAKSPYYYRDKITGELINNGVWKPGYNPVKSYDANEILTLVGQYVSPEKGGYSAPISFLNIDGTLSDTWNPEGGMGVFNQTTGTWERLSEEKIKAAFDAAIAANPGIMASLKQDYEVANWNIDTKGEDIYNIIGKDGSKITFNDFVNRIIDPYSKAKSYYNKTSSITYNDATMSAYNNLRLKKMEYEYKRSLVGSPKNVTIDTLGNPIEIENDTIAKTTERVTFANNSFKNNIAERLANSGYAVDISSLDLDNREKSRQVLVNAGLPVGEIDSIMEEFDREAKLTYADRKYLNTIYNDMSPRAKAAKKLSDDMLMGNKINIDFFNENDNVYRRWTEMSGKIIDNAFANGNIYFGTEYRDEYDTIISALGGINTMKELGFKFIQSQGKYYIGLDKENSEQFFRFSRAIQEQRTNRTTGQNARNTFDPSINALDSYYIDENGSIISTGNVNNPRGSDYNSVFRTADNFLGRMERIADRRIPSNLNTIIAETSISPGGTVEEVQFRQAIAGTKDPKTLSYLKTNLAQQEDNLRTAITGAGVINTNVRTIDDGKKGNQVFRKISGKEVVDITKALQNSDIIKKVTFNLMPISNGDVVTVATIPTGEGKDKSSYKIILEDIHTPATDAYKNDPFRIAGGSLYMSAKSNKPEQIAFYTDDLGNTQNIVLYPTGSQDNSFYIGYGDEVDEDRIVDFTTATNLKACYDALITLNPNNYRTYNEYENAYNVYSTLFDKLYNPVTGIVPLPNYASTNLKPVIDEIIGQ